eukprot:3347374-Pyramimonas_sp.AAC.1
MARCVQAIYADCRGVLQLRGGERKGPVPSWLRLHNATVQQDAHVLPAGSEAKSGQMATAPLTAWPR